MLGYVLSLSLMVVLANLPIRAEFLGSDSVRYTASSVYNDEPVPITFHDLRDRQQKAETSSEAEPTSEEPNAEARPSSREDVARSWERPDRVTALRPASADVTDGVPSIDRTHKLLRHTEGPPLVDDPPSVRVGSMIVRYPISALKRAIQGLVIVRFIVEPNGRASGVQIVKGLDPACDAEVVQAVERARFSPGKRKGREVPAYSQMTVRFVLSETERSGVF